MKRFLCLILVALFVSPVIAGDPPNDILTTAASNGSFNTLVSLCVAADLDETLQGKGDFTVFAPTDEAFAKLPQGTLESLLKPENKAQLASILKYHVINQTVNVSAKAPRHPARSAKSLLGPKINFKRDGDQLLVNGNKVTIRNIRCSNGIIQVIDGVLLPPEDKSILGIADKAGQFSTLLAAIKAADLEAALGSKGPFTVFAPTDKAFAALPQKTVKSLLKPENKDQLIKILKYHVVSGKVDAGSALNSQSAKTLAGQSVQFELKEGQLRINQSRVINNDIEASNGIIHVIDKVLMPAAESQHGSTRNKTITITSSWRNPVRRSNIKADKLIIRCSTGNINLSNIEAGQIETTITGGGRVTLSGVADNHQLAVSGGATFVGKTLKTGTTKVRVNGGGRADVFATKLLKAATSGGATLRYIDSGAKIEKSINQYSTFEPISGSSHQVTSHTSNSTH